MIRKKWYWISATQGGINVLLKPPYESESAARLAAPKRLGSNFYTIEEYDTFNVIEATRMHRAKILQQTHNIPLAVSRMSHKVKEKKENTEEDIGEIDLENLDNNEY